MALDGMMLGLIADEIKSRALGAKIDKIQQPARDKLVLHFRGKNGNDKLLIAASADCPRVHFTQNPPENPASPPMLCMLLRKLLTGGRLAGVRQLESDRVLFFDFDCLSEIGNPASYTLAVEIMGRCSNIILLDKDSMVVDAISRVDLLMSSKRLVLPGIPYEPPPAQDKINPKIFENSQFTIHNSQLRTGIIDSPIINRILSQPGRLDKAILSSMQGLSPIICREISYRCAGSTDVLIEDLTTDQKDRLEFFLGEISNKSTPNAVYDLSGKPIDIAFFPIEQYGSGAFCREYDSFSQLLDEFYSARDLSSQMRIKGHDILKILANATERVSRRLNLQRAELDTAKNREQLKLYGDLIKSNIYRIPEGAKFIDTENYYLPDCPVIRIDLDSRLSPAKNAQAYYKEYRKAQTAEAILTTRIEDGAAELLYLDTVLDALSRVSTDRELAEIRQELSEQGYGNKSQINTSKKSTKKKQPAALPPHEFRVTDKADEFTILVGRNNKQNELLTHKTASKNDTWLHALGVPGSHVIIRAEGRDVPSKVIEQAAHLAAWYSKARESGLVPIDYTYAGRVKKHSSGKPGLVTYTGQNTVYVKAKLIEN